MVEDTYQDGAGYNCSITDSKSSTDYSTNPHAIGSNSTPRPTNQSTNSYSAASTLFPTNKPTNQPVFTKLA